MAERESKLSDLQLKALGGANERVSPANLPPGQFDIVEGMYPARSGLLERIPGKTLLLRVNSPVWNIYQTFDSRNNILVQTDTDVQVFTLDELLDRAAAVPVLTPASITDEDSMAYALIVHKEVVNVHAGASTTAYVQRKLTDIVEQKNPDGSAAAFVTGIANGSAGTLGAFTLAAGTYRIKAEVAAADDTAGTRFMAILWNNTLNAAAFPGAINQAGTSTIQSGGSTANHWIKLGGTITIAVPTQFEIRQKASVAKVNSGFGKAGNEGEHEIYAWVEITKTA